MRIGLISDTHIPVAAKELWPEIFEAFRGVDLIMHGGDLLIPEVIDWLEEIAPVMAVEGNGDYTGPERSIAPTDPRLSEAKVLKVNGPGGRAIRIGLVHDFQLPEAPPDHVLRIDDQTWQGLEKNLGRSLEKWAREEITAATDEFVRSQYIRIDDNIRSKLYGSQSSPTSISKLRTNLVRVLKNWGDIQNDPTAQQILEDVSTQFRIGNVDDMMRRLRHLNACLDFREKPVKYDVFSRYVKKIYVVCKKVAGKRLSITVPAYEDQKTSLFVEVVQILNAALPDWAQQDHSTDAAWAQAVYRAKKLIQ